MPVDRSAIDSQLREIGEGERWWEQREFRDLPHILNADERIRAIVRGRLIARRRPRLLPAAAWLIVLTDQRLLCLQQERFGRKQVDVRLDQITGLRHGARIRSYRVVVETSHRSYRVRLAKEDAFRFVGALSSAMPERPEPPGAHRWLPGAAALPALGGLVSRVAGLPAPDCAPRADLERVEATVERLESQVERLQQQVEFLEKLLQERAGEGHSRLTDL